MAESEPRIPEKDCYKIGEVCRLTDTQPYVLRFWESEFPSLAPQKTRSGQRIYRREDIEMVMRIKELLYEESYTIAGARKKLECADSGAPLRAPKSPAPQAASAPPEGQEARRDRSRLVSLKSQLQELLDLLE